MRLQAQSPARMGKAVAQSRLRVELAGGPVHRLEEEMAELGKKPKFIAESRSGDNLPDLFENKLIDVAVVSRFEFPAPGPEKPKTPREWFTKRYQIITAQTVGSVPQAE